MKRVVSVLLSHAPHLRTPRHLLDAYRTTTGWSEALLAAGLEPVTVIGFTHDDELRHGGADYVFVAGSHAPMRSRRLPWRLLRRVRDLRPDVVHLHSLIFPLQARALRCLLPSEVPIVVQHHAERPFGGWQGSLQRWGLAPVDGYFFNGDAVADPFRRAGVIRPSQPVYEVLEGSQWREAAYADLETVSLVGEPALFWVGNLTPNKDPLTVLGGLERVLADFPEAHLHMAFRSDELLPEVRERLAASPRLARAVTLLGPLPHDALVAHLRGADLFVQGSRHEGSGYGLVDALACGVVPVVTDIPSFRMILGPQGSDELGALWSHGDEDTLVGGLRRTLARPLARQKEAARRRFDEALSWPAVGRVSRAAYEDLVARRASITSR